MKKRWSKKLVSALLALLFALSASIVALAQDYTRYNRLYQPYSSYTFDCNSMGVVNFHPVWRDKTANVNSMIRYIEQAKENNLKILLFPEMCVTGYISSDDPQSDEYQTAVSLAENKNGDTANKISKLAKSYNMLIVYGATETVENDPLHAYNSAFVCTPDGEVMTYQKICPEEGSWCKPGDSPLLIKDETFGYFAVSIGADTYEAPEIERYYAAKGCSLLLNLSASSKNYIDIDDDGKKETIGWLWYYKNRLESITYRDGFAIMSANLVGGDDTGKYDFPGGSVILRDGKEYVAGVNKGIIITEEEGIVQNREQLYLRSGDCCQNDDFSPEYYALWYDEIADVQETGKSLTYDYNGDDGPLVAVANMKEIWGDKQKSIEKIKEYITQAGESGVDILVFPETILTGYSYKITSADPYYIKTGFPMQVALAETIPGPSTEYLSKYAKKYGMYIVIGMPEKEEDCIYDSSDNYKIKVYNSTAILFPDGKIEKYRKMHRAGDEFSWSVCGETPYMFDTKWGKVGVAICRDGHYYPEIARYYALNGCFMLVHSSVTNGDFWYRETLMSPYTDRDGLAVISCNQYSSSTFNTSIVITKFNDNNNFTFNTVTGRTTDLNCVGGDSENFSETKRSPEGLEIAKLNLKGCGFKSKSFNARLFSKMYDELAVLYRENYKSIYNRNGDVDDNTDINIADATLIQKVIVDLESDNGKCDIDKDGTITIMDVTLLQKYIAELVDSL